MTTYKLSYLDKKRPKEIFYKGKLYKTLGWGFLDPYVNDDDDDVWQYWCFATHEGTDYTIAWIFRDGKWDWDNPSSISLYEGK